MEKLDAYHEFDLLESTGFDNACLSGVHIDTTNGYAIVHETKTSRFLLIDPSTGKLVDTYPSGVGEAGDLCVDSHGRIYLCDQACDTVRVYENYIHVDNILVHPKHPYRITPKKTGGIFLCAATRDNYSVLEYVDGGELIWQWTMPFGLTNPGGYSLIPVATGKTIMLIGQEEAITRYVFSENKEDINRRILFMINNEASIGHDHGRQIESWTNFLQDATAGIENDHVLILRSKKQSSSWTQVLTLCEPDGRTRSVYLDKFVMTISSSASGDILATRIFPKDSICKLLVYRSPSWKTVAFDDE